MVFHQQGTLMKLIIQVLHGGSDVVVKYFNIVWHLFPYLVVISIDKVHNSLHSHTGFIKMYLFMNLINIIYKTLSLMKQGRFAVFLSPKIKFEILLHGHPIQNPHSRVKAVENKGQTCI